MKPEERRVSIESDGISLEGLVREGDSDVVAVVLHPHPQYGGDMFNHVVATLCEAFAGQGAATLRFNFRGTGGSGGSHDGGRGEVDDAAAACMFARSVRPSAHLVLAGYSFGALVAANAARIVRPNALVLVSPPLEMAPPHAIDHSLPVLLITGERDRIAPASAIKKLAGESRTAVVVPDADHGWWPGVDELAASVLQFIDLVFARQAQVPSPEA
jgi:hypothetical protein